MYEIYLYIVHFVMRFNQYILYNMLQYSQIYFDENIFWWKQLSNLFLYFAGNGLERKRAILFWRKWTSPDHLGEY